MDSLRKVRQLRRWVESQKTEARLIEVSLKAKKKSLLRKKRLLENLTMAQWVITEVAKNTQADFKKYVETLVTKAINPVFDRPYTFVLDYGIKGRRAFAQPLIQEENGEPQIPKDEMGASILDVISFAFRVVLWNLENPKSREVIWLDEPMRDMGKGKFLERSSDMLKEISQKLGIQLIIITHESELSRIGDAVFIVGHNGEHSEIMGGVENAEKEES